MRVISHRNLMRAASRHPRSVTPVVRWHYLMTQTVAFNLVELRRAFPAVDQVRNTLVFNIGGNHYRLLCCVDWVKQRVYFRALLTHAEYDRANLEELCP